MSDEQLLRPLSVASSCAQNCHTLLAYFIPLIVFIALASSSSQTALVLDLIAAAILILSWLSSMLELISIVIGAALVQLSVVWAPQYLLTEAVVLAMLALTPTTLKQSIILSGTVIFVSLLSCVFAEVVLDALLRTLLLCPIAIASYLNSNKHHETKLTNNIEFKTDVDNGNVLQPNIASIEVNKIIDQANQLCEGLSQRHLNIISSDALEQLKALADNVTKTLILARPLVDKSLLPLQEQADHDTAEWLRELLDDPHLLNDTKHSTSNHHTQTHIRDKKCMSSLTIKTFGMAEGKLKSALSNVFTWNNFNIFTFTELSLDRPCFYIGWVMMYKYDLIQKFRIDERKLANMLNMVDKGYRDVAYHNRAHAADVTQSCQFLLTDTGLIDLLTELDLFVIIIASLFHDFDHPGVSNSFLVATNDDLAVTYNDESCLENHHISAAFKIMLKDPDCLILENLSETQFKHFRSSVIQVIKSTDMARHVKILSQFKYRSSSNCRAYAREVFDDRIELMQMALKCADISHPTKPWNLHLMWSECVNEEFFSQGDRERDHGLPISTFMDRFSTPLWKSQIGFIDFLVYPLFEAFLMHFEASRNSSHPILKQIRMNRASWTKMSTSNNTL